MEERVELVAGLEVALVDNKPCDGLYPHHSVGILIRFFTYYLTDSPIHLCI